MFLGFSHVRQLPKDGLTDPEVMVRFFEGMASVTIASAGMALVIVEVMASVLGGVMVIGNMLIDYAKRQRQRHREQEEQRWKDSIDQRYGPGTYSRVIEAPVPVDDGEKGEETPNEGNGGNAPPPVVSEP